jgi:Tol biopolymer transport system component
MAARNTAAKTVAILLGGVAFGQTTELVSVSTGGAPANWHSYAPSISADARCVAFHSAANLVAGDTNGVYDVFLRDRQSATTELVSVSTAGAQGDGHSYEASISADARYVAFSSLASNLVAGDTNGFYDTFVRDRQSGTTVRVSVATGGAQGDSESLEPSISADGRYVAFRSRATNFVVSDTNAVTDIFVHDRQSGTTERVSVATNGTQGDADSFQPTISAGGRYVAFESLATTLVAGDTNGYRDIFVRDRQSGTTARVSVAIGGAQADWDSFSPAISADGRYVAFDSRASNLVAADTNGFFDVFVRDLQGGTTELVSVSTGGTQGNSDSGAYYGVSISADARSVAFDSLASNLVAGDTNGWHDVFLRDRQSGTTERVSVSTGGTQADGHSYLPSVSANGRCVAFESFASNLVAVDSAYRDVFLRDRACAAAVNYCTAGTSSHGCAAVMSSNGTASVSASTAFTLSASNVEGQKSGLIFYGFSGRTAVPWGSGGTSLLCVKSPTQRTPTQSSNGTANACDGALSLDWNVFVAAHPSALGAPFVAGQVLDAQAWFRDPPTVKQTSLSDGLEFTLCP